MSSIDPRRTGMPPFFTTVIAQLTSSIQYIARAVIPQYVGTARFVAPTGDDANDGLTWTTAKRTLNGAMAVANPRGAIFVEGGHVYDENVAATGFLCDVPQVLVRAVGTAEATIRNTDTTNGGAAVTITREYVHLERFFIEKGETTSTNSAGVRFTGPLARWGKLHECIVSVGNAATHVGVQFTGGAFANGMTSRDPVRSFVVGAGVGTAVDFDNGVRNFLSKTGVGIAATGVRFGGSASFCSIGPECIVQTTTTAISLEAGATSNIIRAVIWETDIPIRNLSGNATNITEPRQDAVEKLITLDGSGTYDIFLVRGQVRVNYIYGIVTTATPAGTTAASLQQFPAGGPAIQITSLAGSDISSLPVGSMLSKDAAAATAITVADNTNGFLLEAVGFLFASFAVSQKTGGVTTHIRLNVTEAGASGAIRWQANWEQLSPDGALEPA